MRYRIVVVALAAIGCFIVAGVSSAQSQCTGEVRATYAGEDDAKDPGFVDHVFGVEVRSDARCAKVDYRLTVVEKSADGETTTNVREFNQKVRDRESRVRKVKYRLARDVQVESYAFEVTACRPCGS